jgi:hypothetical protein
MPTIDADAHVIESERTWDYIEDDKLREDNIVIGSDYGHADTSAEIEALRKFKGMGEKGDR